ncbi:MAG: alpha-glucan family phosphorylase [Phycisphaerales bacterium]|nr:alpha-glucan family phosphorylase [Phycisphaerales bacterium]
MADAVPTRNERGSDSPYHSRFDCTPMARTSTASSSRKTSTLEKTRSRARIVVPAPLSPARAREQLRDLAMNVWWTWNATASRAFAAIDPVLWDATKHSPLELLERVQKSTLAAACEEPGFRLALADALIHRAQSLNATPWYRRQAKLPQDLRVAYFCSEYAIHESMQQYSGGLGVLAGDHLKSASDLGVPLTAVGLLYEHGYYQQQFAQDGTTRVLYPRIRRETMPIVDTGHRVACPIGSSLVYARIWKVAVGRVSLFLLDADLAENKPEDRLLTEGLYKGEPQLRLRQQVLLGVGGSMALRIVDASPTVYHLNEGHAAFAAIERCAHLVERGATKEQAMSSVRASTAFTTHTPVPAGHDRYTVDEVWSYLRPTLERAQCSRADLAALGRERPKDEAEPLCMTVVCLRLASKVNGVAKLHGEVSRAMWTGAYGVKSAASVPISSITNGVHLPTWMHPLARDFWRTQAGFDPLAPEPNAAGWKKALDVDRAAFWSMRCALRAQLVAFARVRLARAAARRGASAAAMDAAQSMLRSDALTIGFARRFATYKRAPLLLHDLERLAKLLSNEKRPVQFLYAGKAHPRDTGGQELAQQIYQLAENPLFQGKIVLLEEYDMEVGRALVAGCDVWLNTPLRPHEASGTSGMKVPLHGGINCSILDGWWPEAFDGDNGWAIGDERELPREARDRADAESLYKVLEKSVVKEFFTRDRNGLPMQWIDRALASAATVSPVFSSHRMVADYCEKSYRMQATKRAR